VAFLSGVCWSAPPGLVRRGNGAAGGIPGSVGCRGQRERPAALGFTLLPPCRRLLPRCRSRRPPGPGRQRAGPGASGGAAPPPRSTPPRSAAPKGAGSVPEPRRAPRPCGPPQGSRGHGRPGAPRAQPRWFCPGRGVVELLRCGRFGGALDAPPPSWPPAGAAAAPR